MANERILVLVSEINKTHIVANSGRKFRPEIVSRIWAGQKDEQKSFRSLDRFRAPGGVQLHGEQHGSRKTKEQIDKIDSI